MTATSCLAAFASSDFHTDIEIVIEETSSENYQPTDGEVSDEPQKDDTKALSTPTEADSSFIGTGNAALIASTLLLAAAGCTAALAVWVSKSEKNKENEL